MRNHIRNLLNTKISLPLYLFILASILVGIVAVFAIGSPEIIKSEFSRNLLIRYDYWAWTLLGSSIITFVGCFIKRHTVLKFGSFITFCMWFFTCVSYCIVEQYVAFGIFGLPYLLTFAYIYLASSLGVIHRTAIRNIHN